MRRLSVFVLIGLLLLSSCATVKQDTKALFQDIATCAKNDPANAQLADVALQCLISAIAQDYVQCFSVLPPIENWTANELICVAKALQTNTGITQTPKAQSIK